MLTFFIFFVLKSTALAETPLSPDLPIAISVEAVEKKLSTHLQIGVHGPLVAFDSFHIRAVRKLKIEDPAWQIDIVCFIQGQRFDFQALMLSLNKDISGLNFGPFHRWDNAAQKWVFDPHYDLMLRYE